MPLPAYDRVIFRKSPLRLVVGQVRFPVLPSFGDGGLIARFSDEIRTEFPSRTKENQLTFQISPKGVEQAPGETLWRLSTRDRLWSVVVGETAITLEVKGYSSVDEFLARFSRVLAAARSALNVTDRTRIGLRYINEIRHPEGRSLAAWARFLKPELVGFAASELLEGTVEQMIQEIRISRPDGTLAIRHGLQRGTILEPIPPDVPDQFYMLDLDYFDTTECELEVTQVAELMRAYNDTMYRFFRWSLSEELYRFLEPTDA